MNGFFIAVITLPLGTIALFWLFRPREEPAAKDSKTPESPPSVPVNRPLIIVGVLLLVTAVVSLLSAGQVTAAVMVFPVALAIVGLVLFAKAREAEWKHREWPERVPPVYNEWKGERCSAI
jgi:Na+/H+ antiporter NhaD/arsenite permease-like protein